MSLPRTSANTSACTGANLYARTRIGKVTFNGCVPRFGNWNSNFRRFRRWAIKGVFDVLFERLSGDPDFEYAMIDGTIVRVHQQGTGARGGLIVRRSDVHAAA